MGQRTDGEDSLRIMDRASNRARHTHLPRAWCGRQGRGAAQARGRVGRLPARRERWPSAWVGHGRDLYGVEERLDGLVLVRRTPPAEHLARGKCAIGANPCCPRLRRAGPDFCGGWASLEQHSALQQQAPRVPDTVSAGAPRQAGSATRAFGTLCMIKNHTHTHDCREKRTP